MSDKEISILVVDDDPSITDMLAIVLTKTGFNIHIANNGAQALKYLRKRDIDLIISDIKMPGISGIELLKKVKSIRPGIPVIMITAFASTSDAVEAMKLGAEDYVIKPFNLDELQLIIEKSLSRKQIENENIELKSRLKKREQFENIIGRDAKMVKIYEMVDTVAQTDSSVLITGESGTGKELIARAIHNKGPRSNQKFVSINCGALPENLLESELFGHIRGSFTDAYKDKAGLFEVADRGTLFLDEISEMSSHMQVKLLRALQERLIRRVGGNEELPVDVKIISATNRDLRESLTEGTFRSDLYYRLNVISIAVPPLRERKSDIPLLMYFFLKKYNDKFNKQIRDFSDEVLELAEMYHWPGNVREIENFVERAVALEKATMVKLESIPPEMILQAPSIPRDADDLEDVIRSADFDFYRHIEMISRDIVVKALELNRYHLKDTAGMLKMNYRSLRYLMGKYKLRK